MDGKREIVYNKLCDICGQQKIELVQLTKYKWFWSTEMFVCQGCISRIFRSFNKDR